MAETGHIDTFARDNLPPREQWPEFKFDLPELQYPERLNCVTEWVDRWVAAGQGDRPCLISPAETLTYAQLHERVNRIANVLTRDQGTSKLAQGPSSATALVEVERSNPNGAPPSWKEYLVIAPERDGTSRVDDVLFATRRSDTLRARLRIWAAGG